MGDTGEDSSIFGALLTKVNFIAGQIALLIATAFGIALSIDDSTGRFGGPYNTLQWFLTFSGIFALNFLISLLIVVGLYLLFTLVRERLGGRRGSRSNAMTVFLVVTVAIGLWRSVSAMHSLPSDFEPGIEAMIGVVALAGVALYLIQGWRRVLR